MTHIPLKISIPGDNGWEPLDNPAAFIRQGTGSGAERLKIVLPADARNSFRHLTELMNDPFYLLYVLHTPRGEGEPGRYQSPELSAKHLAEFLLRFETYLACDARHDLWVKSVNSNELLIWTRHNELYAYGEVSKFASSLLDLQFNEQELPILGEHLHHYRPEFDADAAAVLATLQWTRIPLLPEDEQ